MANTEPRLIPINEVGPRIGVGKTRVYSLINAGQLEAVKIGRKTLIPADALAAFIAGLPRLPSTR